MPGGMGNVCLFPDLLVFKPKALKVKDNQTDVLGMLRTPGVLVSDVGSRQHSSCIFHAFLGWVGEWVG